MRSGRHRFVGVTIDERLGRLAEHHEALTQSVELLTSDLRDLQAVVRELARQHGGLARRNEKLESLVTDIAEGTARLLHVVQAHEHRISDLEGNQTQ